MKNAGDFGMPDLSGYTAEQLETISAASSEAARNLRKSAIENLELDILEMAEKAGRPIKKIVWADEKVKLPPKYRSPEGETWSGKGRAPGWAKKLKESGILENYRISV